MARASFLIVLLVGLLPTLAAAGELGRRYFYQGSGQLHLHNLRNGLEGTINLLDGDGLIDQAGLAEADRLLGYPGEEKGEHFSPRLLFVLSYFVDRLAPGAKVTVESAYRSREYNQGIRAMGANAARTSTHIDGMALDFSIAGIAGLELWETIRREKCCGVGHYGGKDIHLDVGRPRFWQAGTSGTKTAPPDRNRHAYLAAEYDRYQAGEPIRLALSGLSDFSFGVRPDLLLEAATNGQKALVASRTAATACIPVKTEHAARFLLSRIPPGLPPGRYQLQLGFCAKPFAEMPDEIWSRPFEVVAEADHTASSTLTNDPNSYEKTPK